MAHSASTDGLSAGRECLSSECGSSTRCLQSGPREPGTGGLLAVKGQPVLVVQTFNSSTWEAKAYRSLDLRFVSLVYIVNPGQPESHNETLSQRTKQNKLCTRQSCHRKRNGQGLVLHPLGPTAWGHLSSNRGSSRAEGGLQRDKRRVKVMLLLQFAQQRTKAFGHQHQV